MNEAPRLNPDILVPADLARFADKVIAGTESIEDYKRKYLASLKRHLQTTNGKASYKVVIENFEYPTNFRKIQDLIGGFPEYYSFVKKQFKIDLNENRQFKLDDSTTAPTTIPNVPAQPTPQVETPIQPIVPPTPETSTAQSEARQTQELKSDHLNAKDRLSAWGIEVGDRHLYLSVEECKNIINWLGKADSVEDVTSSMEEILEELGKPDPAFYVVYNGILTEIYDKLESRLEPPQSQPQQLAAQAPIAPTPEAIPLVETQVQKIDLITPNFDQLYRERLLQPTLNALIKATDKDDTDQLFTTVPSQDQKGRVSIKPDRQLGDIKGVTVKAALKFLINGSPVDDKIKNTLKNALEYENKKYPTIESFLIAISRTPNNPRFDPLTFTTDRKLVIPADLVETEKDKFAENFVIDGRFVSMLTSSPLGVNEIALITEQNNGLAFEESILTQLVGLPPLQRLQSIINNLTSLNEVQKKAILKEAVNNQLLQLELAGVESKVGEAVTEDKISWMKTVGAGVAALAGVLLAGNLYTATVKSITPAVTYHTSTEINPKITKIPDGVTVVTDKGVGDNGWFDIYELQKSKGINIELSPTYNRPMKSEALAAFLTQNGINPNEYSIQPATQSDGTVISSMLNIKKPELTSRIADLVKQFEKDSNTEKKAQLAAETTGNRTRPELGLEEANRQWQSNVSTNNILIPTATLGGGALAFAGLKALWNKRKKK